MSVSNDSCYGRRRQPLYFTAVLFFISSAQMKDQPGDFNQTWHAGRKWCRFVNAPQNSGELPTNLGGKKTSRFWQFFRDFRTRHCIYTERNVASTNQNVSVNLQCVPYKVIYFPWPLIQKRLRSVAALWLIPWKFCIFRHCRNGGLPTQRPLKQGQPNFATY